MPWSSSPSCMCSFPASTCRRVSDSLRPRPPASFDIVYEHRAPAHLQFPAIHPRQLLSTRSLTPDTFCGRPLVTSAVCAWLQLEYTTFPAATGQSGAAPAPSSSSPSDGQQQHRPVACCHWTATDRVSRNGTFLNAVRINPKTSVRLVRCLYLFCRMIVLPLCHAAATLCVCVCVPTSVPANILMRCRVRVCVRACVCQLLPIGPRRLAAAGGHRAASHHVPLRVHRRRPGADCSASPLRCKPWAWLCGARQGPGDRASKHRAAGPWSSVAHAWRSSGGGDVRINLQCSGCRERWLLPTVVSMPSRVPAHSITRSLVHGTTYSLANSFFRFTSLGTNQGAGGEGC